MEKSLSFLGGDSREVVAANVFLKAGYAIKVFGLPKEELLQENSYCSSLFHAVKNTDILILPVRGVNEEGKLYAPLLEEDVIIDANILKTMAPNGEILCGVASKYLTDLGESLGIKVTPMMERDEIAIPNAIPTAEGTLAIAAEKTPITLFGAKVVVMGFGRVGKAVAKIFRSVGSRVSICCRNPKEIKEGKEMGYDIRRYQGISSVLPHCDIVVNTVPAMVLPKERLATMKKGALIVDLASFPGGVDFNSADAYGITAVHALGLPGIYAPITAGKILATGMIEYLQENTKVGR